MSSFIKEVKMKQGKIAVHKGFAIARFDEGANLIAEDAEEILAFIKETFDGPFCWLSDRINSYSIDPTILLSMIKELPNLKAIAQTTYGNSMKDSTKIAQVYLPGDLPYKSFEELEEAIEWIEEQLASFE